MPAPVYALVGNPNCGKSTLFNALTGLKAKVGNYPGVTVEKKAGTAYSQHGQPMPVIDLPGTYSLAARSPDEAITRDVLLGRRPDTPAPDRILCIVDATNLDRSLYLVHQVLDLGRPVIVVANMMDLAAKAGIEVRVDRLEQALGVPVIPCEAVNGKGIIELRLAMSRHEPRLSRHAWDIPAAIAPAVTELQASLSLDGGRPPLVARAEALLLLTDLDTIRVAGSAALSPRTVEILRSWRARWTADGTDWAGILVNSRYASIGRLVADAVRRTEPNRRSTSDRIDAAAIHPVWGWILLIAVMTLLFFGIFTLAEYPMDWIGGRFDALTGWIKREMPAGDLRDLISDGAIQGVGSVVTFLPQILILFLFIGLLESSGYMARAAFMMDRLMSRVGLSGKSFIPLLSSYACAIPGVMAARTIEDPQDRMVTILIAPLMSCSARLPVYLLMIAAMMPGDAVPLAAKVGIMVLMYGLGTVGAFAFAWIFRRTLLKSGPPMMILELPPYQRPRMKEVLRQMAERSGGFLKGAGTMILAISILLWALSAYPKPTPGATPSQALAESYAGKMGRVIEPLIRPLGFDWRIGVGLVTSFAAREVFVSSTAVVFNADGGADSKDVTPLRKALGRARWPDGRVLFTPLTCLSLMIYYVFAMQCMSTVAVVRRETGTWRWPLFQTAYMTGAAWVLSFIVFQGGRALGF